jgi:hypothetical protein
MHVRVKHISILLTVYGMVTQDATRRDTLAARPDQTSQLLDMPSTDAIWMNGPALKNSKQRLDRDAGDDRLNVRCLTWRDAELGAGSS